MDTHTRNILSGMECLIKLRFYCSAEELLIIIQFVCTHRRSYKPTPFEKEQSIA